MKIRVLVNGAKGRMGSLAASTVRADLELELVGETDLGDDLKSRIAASRAEVVVDFTHPEAAAKNTETILQVGACPVIGTTGLEPQDIRRLQELAARLGRGGLIVPNFAIGVILMMKFAAAASKYLPDIEIIELHHNQKADAPSGTAIKTAEWILAERTRPPQGSLVPEKETLPGARGGKLQDIPIHSVRLPGLVAHQEVIFGGLGQILTIRHDALSRESYMPGVVLAIKKVKSLKGLLYGLENVLDV